MTCDLYQQRGAVFRWWADLTLKEQILLGSEVWLYMNYSCTCFLGEYGGPYSCSLKAAARPAAVSGAAELHCALLF